MKNKKLFGIFSAFTLAAAGVAAFTSGVSHKNVIETEAAEGTIYLTLPSNYFTGYSNYKLKANCNIGDNNTYWTYEFSLTDKTYNAMPVFKADINNKYGGFDQLQLQIYEGSNWRAQFVPFTSWTTTDKVYGKLFVYNDYTIHNASFDGNYVANIGGTNYNLTYSKTDFQYSVTDLALNVGDELKITCGGSNFTYQDGASTNLKDHKIFCQGDNYGIYLKNEDFNAKAYVSNYSERQVVIDDVRYKTKDNGQTEVFVTNVFIKKDSIIKAGYRYNDPYKIWLDEQEFSEKSNFQNAGDSGFIKCLNPGVYKLYLKSYDGGYNFNNIYIAYDDNFYKAVSFAKESFDALSEVCDWNGNTNITTLQNKWNSIKNEFNNLGDSKSFINYEDGNNEICEFIEIYDFVLNKYNFNDANYLNRSVSSSSKLNPISAFGNADNSVWIISAVVLVGLASIGGYFFYRKRKEI